MSGSRRGDMPGAGVSQVWQVDAVEQPLARAKQDRRNGDMKFVDQPLPKILPDCRRSASDADILSLGGFSSTFQRDVYPFGDEMKRRAALHVEWRASMIGEHENLGMVNGILPPPSPPALIGPGPAHGPEHIPAHNPGPDIMEAARGKVVVNPGLPLVASEQLRLKRAGGERPSMQGRSTNAERVLQALVRACAESIKRYGEAFYAESGHLFGRG